MNRSGRNRHFNGRDDEDGYNRKRPFSQALLPPQRNDRHHNDDWQSYQGGGELWDEMSHQRKRTSRFLDSQPDLLVSEVDGRGSSRLSDCRSTSTAMKFPSLMKLEIPETTKPSPRTDGNHLWHEYCGGGTSSSGRNFHSVSPREIKREKTWTTSAHSQIYPSDPWSHSQYTCSVPVSSTRIGGRSERPAPLLKTPLSKKQSRWESQQDVRKSFHQPQLAYSGSQNDTRSQHQVHQGQRSPWTTPNNSQSVPPVIDSQYNAYKNAFITGQPVIYSMANCKPLQPPPPPTFLMTTHAPNMAPPFSHPMLPMPAKSTPERTLKPTPERMLKPTVNVTELPVKSTMWGLQTKVPYSQLSGSQMIQSNSSISRPDISSMQSYPPQNSSVSQPSVPDPPRLTQPPMSVSVYVPTSISITARAPIVPVKLTQAAAKVQLGLKTKLSMKTIPNECDDKPPSHVIVGRRRGKGRALPCGVIKRPEVEKPSTEHDRITKTIDTSKNLGSPSKSASWSRYMKEVEKYRNQTCSDETPNRSLVK